MSRLFGRTLREMPSGAEIASHQLLLRAGMIRQLTSGMYTTLPLAQRSLHKIEQIVREEMNAIGGQEINMPLVNPVELWEESGRLQEVGKELVSFTDRAGRELVLAMTHEEAITNLIRNEINSYRQLPLMLYQIKLKFRDESRPRAGLIRVREFTMKDAYSLHTNESDLDEYYEKVREAYLKIFHRCGLEVVVVESDPGMMGGKEAHEFMLITESGEDKLILCPNCGYTANSDVAVIQNPSVDNGEPADIEEVATPGKKTIEAVANYLNIEKSQTMKAVFYSTSTWLQPGERLVFVAIRGDLEVNELKLQNALKAPEISIASEDEVARYGLVAGYASPIGLKNVTVVVDDSVEQTTNLVAGANKEGYHLKNVNFPRDFQADIVTDIALARENDTCVHCGGKFKSANGIEAGHIFKLGTKYSEAMGATYLDQNGKSQSIIMGCYGIGIGRLLASVVEYSHDEDGIIWPISVAPYHIHLMHIGKGKQIIEKADEIYESLLEDGCEVLYDDRDESPGVKFKDADLIGIPIRLTVSNRSLKKDSIELKYRHKKEHELIEFEEFNARRLIERLLNVK